VERADLELLVEYLAAADAKVLDRARTMPDEPWRRALASSHGSLAATVEHLFATEWTWLERIEGRSPDRLGPPGGATDRDVLAAAWPRVWAGWRAAVAQRAPEAPVAYRTTAGVAHTTPFAHIVLHVSHHSATYRGQVAAIQRALGFAPVSADLIAHLRQRDGR
jgi:uncharacterized damage-inducible protein DinB